MLAGALRWSSTAVTDGRLVAVGWQWGWGVGSCRVGLGNVGLGWEMSGQGRGFIFLALVWLGLGVVGHWFGVGVAGGAVIGAFLLGGIIARIRGVFRVILGNFWIG